MEDEIQRGVPDTGRRPGSSAAPAARSTSTTWTIVSSSDRARSIIVLAPETRRSRRGGDQDAAGHHQRPAPPAGAVPHRGRDPRRRATSKSRAWSAATRRSWSLVGDLIARIIAQTCRQRACRSCTPSCSTSAATRSTSRREPELVGRTFGDALLAYEDLGVIGHRARGRRRRCSTRRWTRSSRRRPTVIVDLARTTTRSSAPTGRRRARARSSIVDREHRAACRRRSARWSSAGTRARRRSLTRARSLRRAGLAADRRRRGVRRRRRRRSRGPQAAQPRASTYRHGDTTDRARARRARPPTATTTSIVLCYSDLLDAQTRRRADAGHAAPSARHRGDARRDASRSVSEMLDVRNRELAEVTSADDFIVSDKLVSLMLSQVSENRELTRGLRRPVRPRGLRDLPEAGHRLRRAGHAGRLLHRRRGGPPPRRGGHRLPTDGQRQGSARRTTAW